MFVLKSFRHLHLPGCNIVKLNQRFMATCFHTIQSNPIISPSVYQKNFCRQNSTSTSQTTSKNQIYLGPLTPKIRAVKVFSLSTSVIGIGAQPLLIDKASQLGGTSIVILVCSFVGFFTFITPLVLHFITKKYVTEINYDAVKDEYTATTLSIFLRKKEVTTLTRLLNKEFIIFLISRPSFKSKTLGFLMCQECLQHFLQRKHRYLWM